MNKLEKEMVKVLKELKGNYGAVEVKAEFETEASRMNELMRLKEILDFSGLSLVIKIGGAEAITDMYETQHLGITGLMAPMIESSYSAKKFIDAVFKYYPQELRDSICFGINLETIQGYKNLDEILSSNTKKLISLIVLGRTDMCGSLNLSKDNINSDEIYKIAEDIFTRAKKRGLSTALGGGMSWDSVTFIKKLASQKLLDMFETRKIRFKTPKDYLKIGEAIYKANTFELMWLENKKNYYGTIFREDDERIKSIKKRIKIGKKSLKI